MEQRNKPASDEIDLTYFFKPLANVFNYIFQFIREVLLFFKRNMLLFALSFLTFLALCYGLNKLLPQYYKTDAIFMSNTLPNTYCVSMISNLNAVISTGGNETMVTSYLNIPSESIKQIKEITALPLDTLYNIELDKSVTKSSPFKVSIIVKDIRCIPLVQQGLVNYFENNSYANKRKEARKEVLIALRNNFQQKAIQLDSLKRIVNSSIVPRSNAQGIILGEPVSPVEVYKLEQEYYTQKLDIDKELNLLQNIDLVQPFIIGGVANYSNFNNKTVIYFVISLLLAILITFCFGKERKELGLIN